MSRRKPLTAAPYRSTTASSWFAPHRLTQIAFILALALVACRVLMPESIREPIDVISAARLSGGIAGPDTLSLAQSPQSPGPAGGLVLDLLFCIPALLVLARRAFDTDFRLHHSWSHVPMFLLGLLAILSPLWAADKFASLVSATHLFCALILLWTLFQLVRSWLRLRIVAGVGVGLLMALQTVGISYHTYELRDLRETWNEHKSEILGVHGWTAESFQAQNFEKRVLNGEPPGFSTSTNTYAALLVILGVMTAGVVTQHLADRDHWGWIVIPVCALAVTPILIHWTGCRAAYATPVIAAFILLATRFRVVRFARVTYWFVVGSIAIALAVIIRHGLRTGSLWHDSLTFRWRYWTGAWRIVTSGLLYHSPREYSHFLFGVGWENFGPYYLVHRLAIATEEIRDPHNFIIRTVVELGIVGGMLLLIWMLRLAWELTTPVTAPAELQVEPTTAHCSQRMTMAAIASVALIAVAVNIAEAVDFTADGGFVVLELTRRMVFLFLLIVGMICTCVRKAQVPAEKNTPGDIQIKLDARPAPWMLYAILAALGTFLIHNLIEFSLFEPGPLFLFTMLTGAALGFRSQERGDTKAAPVATASRGRLGARIVVVTASLVWLAAAIFVVSPIVTAESLAADADADTAAAFKSKDQDKLFKAIDEMTLAYHAVRYNADFARRAADLMLATEESSSDPARTKQILDAAVAADPSSVQNLIMRAQFELRNPAQTDAGLHDYRCAVTLDPRNVRMRLNFARELLRIAKLRHNRALAGAADLEFDSALDNNAQLPAEEVKRLSPKELTDAERDRAEAEQFGRVEAFTPIEPMMIFSSRCNGATSIGSSEGDEWWIGSYREASRCWYSA